MTPAFASGAEPGHGQSGGLAVPGEGLGRQVQRGLPGRPTYASSQDAGMNCSHSIAHRLSKKLAIFTAIVIGLVSTASWFSVAMMVKQRNLQDLTRALRRCWPTS